MPDLQNTGFNEGYLQITDFKLTNTATFAFFAKLFKFTTGGDNNEINSQMSIFLNMDSILSILSHNFINPAGTITQLNALNNLRGGSNKYTRKKSKRKQIKTRKNNNRKNTIKNIKMKIKKTKRNKHMQKNRK